MPKSTHLISFLLSSIIVLGLFNLNTSAREYFPVSDLVSKPYLKVENASQTSHIKGSSPLDGGIAIITLLAIGYIARKTIYHLKKKKKT
ncbi:MAG: hypothetical protein ACOYO1_14690 [Bacteroidales bacterium]